MFTKLYTATISFIMYVCPSSHLHGITWLPLDVFSWNFMCNYVSKSKFNNFFLKVVPFVR